MNLVVVDIMFVIFLVLIVIFSFVLDYLDGIIGFVLCKLVIGGNVVWIGGVLFIVIFVIIVIECYYVVVYFFES